MAKDLKTKIVIEADAKGAKVGLDTVQKELGQTGKAAKAAGGKTETLGKKFKRLGKEAKGSAKGIDSFRGMIKKAGVAIAAYFSAKSFLGAIKGAANLEEQIDRVASVSADYADRIADIEKASKKLGATTAFTGKQAAEGFEQFARAGIDVDTAIDSMENTLALAKAETMGLAEAADIVTGNLKLWGDNGETAVTITDKLKAGASNARTSVAQLNRAMVDAGPLAKAMGLSLDETVAILGKFADAGFRGERGGTALKIILTQLEDPASNAREALTALGYSGDDFVEMLSVLEKAGPGADAALRSFGTEAGPALRAVLGQGSAAIEELTGKIRDSEGAAKKAAKQMSGNLNGAMVSLGSAWEAVRGALATPLLEPIAEQVRKLSGLFQGWVADGSVARIGELLKIAFDTATKAVREFFGEFDTGEFTQKLSLFVADLGASIGAAKEKFVTLSKAGSTTFTGLSVAFNGFVGTIKIGATTVAALVLVIAKALEGIVLGMNAIGRVSDETLDRFKINTKSLAAVTEALAESAGNDFRSIAVSLGLMSDAGDKAVDFTKGIDVSAEVAALRLKKLAGEGEKAAESIEKIGDISKKASGDLSESATHATTYAEALAGAGKAVGDGWKKGAEIVAGAGTAIMSSFTVVKFEGRKTAKEVGAAFDRMGIKTKASTSTLAAQVEKDWRTIRLSGKATSDGMASAARQYIESWKAAHNGVLPRMMDLTEAHGELYLAILEVRKAEKRKKEAAERAAAAGVAGAREESEAVRRLREEKKKLQQASEDASVAGVQGTEEIGRAHV